MRSIQGKILTLILSSLIISTIVITYIAVDRTNELLERDSNNYLDALCKAEVEEMNQRLEKVENSTGVLYKYFVNQASGSVEQESLAERFDDADDWASIQRVLYAMAVETDWCQTIYVRMNPELYPSNPGLVYMKNEAGEFTLTEPSDILENRSKDEKLVQWFYQPMEEGKATWVEVYNDVLANRPVITYAIPLVEDGIFYGVVGIDVDLDILAEEVENISIYETGTASLLSKQEEWLIDRRQNPVIEELGVQDRQNVFVIRKEPLRNGMELFLSVPRAEIEQPKLNMLSDIILVIFIVTLFVIVLSSYIAARIVKPLQQLTVASQKVAEGYLEVDFEHKSKDEIGILSDSLRRMVAKLRENMQYINRLAYHDVLTNVYNKTAYEEKISSLDEQIKRMDASFGLVFLDINNLKLINDTYGHDVGDSLIADAAEIMKHVFGEESIYRVGGDEFVVLLTDTQLLNHKELINQLNKEQERFNDSHKERPYRLAIAKGVSVFEKGIDLTYADVFRRADHLMYQNKKWVKNQQEGMEEN